MASSSLQSLLHRFIRYLMQHSSTRLHLLSLLSLSSVCCLVIVACSPELAGLSSQQRDRQSSQALESANAPLQAPATTDLSSELQPSASEIVRVASSQSAARSLPAPTQPPPSIGIANPQVAVSPQSNAAPTNAAPTNATQANSTQTDSAQTGSKQTTSETQRVQFAPNQSSAVLEGSVIRGDRAIYILHAKSGQQMDLLLTSIEDNAVFNVIAPDSAILITESTNTQISLPLTGDYQIIISGTRGNATYRLDIVVK